MKTGDIDYCKESLFKRGYWLVCNEVHKTGFTQSMFYNLERAKIYSEIIKLRGTE